MDFEEDDESIPETDEPNPELLKSINRHILNLTDQACSSAKANGNINDASTSFLKKVHTMFALLEEVINLRRISLDYRLVGLYLK